MLLYVCILLFSYFLLNSLLAVNEQRAQALHQAPTQTDAQQPQLSSSTPAPGPSAETLTQPSNSSTAGEGRKWKQGTDTKDKKSHHKAKKGKEPKRPNKHCKVTISLDAEDSATSDDSEPSDDEGIDDEEEEEEEEGEEVGENNDDDEDENRDEDEDLQTINRHTSMDPKRWKGGKAPVKASINTSNVNVKNDIPAPHQSVSLSPAHLSPSLPTAPLTTTPLGPPPPPSSPSPPPRSDMPLGETNSQCHEAASLINPWVSSSATTSVRRFSCMDRKKNRNRTEHNRKRPDQRLWFHQLWGFSVAGHKVLCNLERPLKTGSHRLQPVFYLHITALYGT